MSVGRAAIIATFAFVGWAVCGAAIGVGFGLFTQTAALVLHAIVAPMAFALLSWLYFTRFAYTGPLATAALFLAIVVALDVFVVALVIERSFAMFASVLGTWIPFVLIFGSTWATGLVVERNGGARRAEGFSTEP
jgi:hypothetical protein